MKTACSGNHRVEPRPSCAWIWPALAWLASGALAWAAAGPAQDSGRGLAPVASDLLRDPSLPTYRALLVGISQYQHWPTLPTARSECVALETVLRRDYGFTDIRTLYDRQATREQILRALRKLAGETGAGDAVLVYFSGHGEYDPVIKKGYWIPVEARYSAKMEEVLDQYLDNAQVRDLATGMVARHVLLVSDSCFSGTLLEGYRSPTDALATRDRAWYRRAIAQPSRRCLTSGAEEKVPANSWFAAKFRLALESPLQPVFGAVDLYSRIRAEVSSDSGNLVSYASLRSAVPDRNSEFGEFIFIRRTGLPGAPPPVADMPAPAPDNPLPAADGRKINDGLTPEERQLVERDFSGLSSDGRICERWDGSYVQVPVKGVIGKEFIYFPVNPATDLEYTGPRTYVFSPTAKVRLRALYPRLDLAIPITDWR